MRLEESFKNVDVMKMKVNIFVGGTKVGKQYNSPPTVLYFKCEDCKFSA